ncbi:MAG: hypothetical protein AAF571_06260 [Verrucomicrobiota bacterium]
MKMIKITLSLCAVMALTLTAPMASAHCGNCAADKPKKEEKTDEKKKKCCGEDGCCKKKEKAEKKEEKKEA